MEIYTTLPLRPNSQDIRILELETSEDEDSPIVGTIRVVCLTENPSYFALSYHWGEETPNHSITCNGFPVSVTENLSFGLRRLRKTERKAFWIDQICINQSDLEERDHQVSFMSSIYHMAENVCVWLGVHQANTGLGLKLAHRLASSLNTAVDEDQFPELLSDSVPAESNPSRAFFQLYDNPWFLRCWVVQEVNAKPNPVAYIGDHEFDWNVLPLAHLVLAAHPFVKGHMDLEENRSKLAKQAGVCCFQMAFEFGHLADDLCLHDSIAETVWAKALQVQYDTVDCFLNGAELLATNLRDKVYAFLGFAKDLENLLKPRYALTVQETYLDLSTCLISANLGSRLLASAGLTRCKMQGLPSWCFDLSHAGAGVPTLAQLGKIYKISLLADSSLQGKYFIGPGPSELTVMGLRVDRVKELGPVRTKGASTNTPILNRMQWLNDTHEFVSNAGVATNLRYPTLDEKSKAFYRLIIADEQRFSESATESYNACARHAADLKSGLLTSKKFHYPEWPQATMEYWMVLYMVTRKQRVCVTEQGYLGLVPEIAQVGDEICVVLGCGIPLLMREAPLDKEKRILIDNAFVLGLMHGEALTMDHVSIQEMVLQ